MSQSCMSIMNVKVKLSMVLLLRREKLIRHTYCPKRMVFGKFEIKSQWTKENEQIRAITKKIKIKRMPTYIAIGSGSRPQTCYVQFDGGSSVLLLIFTKPYLMFAPRNL